ncbi:hypothetical protein K2X85_19355 [bacterium]|jgi:hypothetical protein|nr:hypothetical protein [bacterium]
MRTGNWTNYGFWLVTGLAAGMLVSDLTREPAAKADSACRYEEFCMVSGQSYDGEIDIIWVLDYKFGVLHALILNRDGLINTLGTVDLVEQLQLTSGTRVKPHFMMVTGRFRTRGTDYLYLVETETGQVLCVEPPNVGGVERGQALVPRVVSRFRFRKAGD